jgi:hypothetical protein
MEKRSSDSQPERLKLEAKLLLTRHQIVMALLDGVDEFSPDEVLTSAFARVDRINATADDGIAGDADALSQTQDTLAGELAQLQGSELHARIGR